MAKDDKATKATATETTATTASTGKDRSKFTDVVMESFLWRGQAAKTPLTGRIIGLGKQPTKHKSEKQPDGMADAVAILVTEESVWAEENGTEVRAPKDAVVKVIINAALENLLTKAKVAMKLGKSPEIVLQPTGQVRIVPKGKMPLYKMGLEPQPEWPDLKDVAEEFVFGADDFEVEALPPAANRQNAPQLPAATA